MKLSTQNVQRIVSTLLLKLERIRISASARASRAFAQRATKPTDCTGGPPDAPIRGALREMQLLRFGIVPPGSAEAWLFHGLLAHEQSARTSATWCGIGTAARWPVLCSARPCSSTPKKIASHTCIPEMACYINLVGEELVRR